MAQKTTLPTYATKDLSSIQERFEKLTDKRTFELQATFALQAVNKSPQLLKCSKTSILQAIMNVATFGLTLNPVDKEAYLVPRWDKTHGMQAHLEIGYQGLIRKLCEVPQIHNVYTYAVYEGDVFKVYQGLNPDILHEPKFASKNITHVYAVIAFTNGTKQFEVMEWKEIEEIRNTSTSWQAYQAKKISTCIWNDWPQEMARKTVIRRMAKYAPKSDGALQDVIAQDEKDYEPSYGALAFAEQLIASSSYDHDRQGDFLDMLPDMSRAELDNLIIDLQANQLPMTEIQNPSQAQIEEAAKEKVKTTK